MNNEKNSKMDLLIHLIVKVKRDDIFALASQLAYYLVLSFFPFIMFLLTLVGFIHLNSKEVLEGLRTILPISVMELTETTILEVLGSQNTGLLGISIILAVWTASSGFRAVMKGINKAYNIHDERTYIRRAMVSFISTIALALTVLMALASLVFGRVIGNHLIEMLPLKEVIGVIWNVLRYGVIIFVLIFVFAAIYRYTPSKMLKWKEVLPGAIFSTIGWLMISIVFSFYINNYNNYSKFYGSLAAVFILMIWLFLSSIIFMFGVEINSVLDINRQRIKKLNK
ncbi:MULTISPECIES: YihY/virulence factor BrkB family protein [Clostridium]|uniref:YihY/virulence factor BrkB family protein n=1 Tax=Clostridium cibarium TaxID=2762247 RepID=A0ABR8PSH0_9CLOT|nr:MULTISPECIES: YihY/virulence factor BrkB family protein [Clostridium]MBD7911126.1 YihY/virulence factor BrkB family protein [Clostridium cibarium]